MEDVDSHTEEKHPGILVPQKEPEPTSLGCTLEVEKSVENKISEELNEDPDFVNRMTNNMDSKGDSVDERDEVVRVKTLREKAEKKLRDLEKNLKLGRGGDLLRSMAQMLRRRLEQLNQGAPSQREENLASEGNERLIQPQIEFNQFMVTYPRGFTRGGSAPDSLNLLSHKPATVREASPVLQKIWLPAISFPAQSKSGAPMLYCCSVCPASGEFSSDLYRALACDIQKVIFSLSIYTLN